MKIVPVSMLLAMIVAIPVADAQTRSPRPAKGTTPGATAAAGANANVTADASVTAPTGPRVHTSKARDTTECSRTVNGGGKAGFGMGLGALVSNKMGAGSQGILAASAVGGQIGAEMDKSERCGARAQVEDDAAAAADATPRKKRGIGGLRNALGL